MQIGEKTAFEIYGIMNGVKVIPFKEYDFSHFENLKVITGRGRRNKFKKPVMDIVLSFDIETSTLMEYEQSFMYVWQVAINTDTCIIGRTWKEFKDFLLRVAKYRKGEAFFKFWVHNLAYEFSFLKGIYRFKPEEVFIIDGRRVCRCEMLGCIEFCCSYIQTNMNLALLTSVYGATHTKLSGEEYNYTKIRYPWTPLTPDETQYQVHDVIGLNEAMIKRMESFGDTLFSIPMTSTGYVRREVKKQLAGYSFGVLRYILPSYEVYELLEESFRGGNTHANRHYVGKILKNITSYDIQSSYPYQMVCKEFPVGKWESFEKNDIAFSDYEFLLKQGKAVLLRLQMSHVDLRDDFFGNPYIAVHKCRRLINPIVDNGRVLSCDYCEVVINDIDFEMILDIYDFDFTIVEMHYSRYGKLPQEIIDVVLKYFRTKTEFKGLKDEKSVDLYLKAKNLLNSCYGMMAQKPVKQTIDFLIEEEFQFQLQHESRRSLYEAYCEKPFLSFAWGCWVTSHARKDLHDGMKLCGKKLVYVDTDCCKFFTDKRIKKKFEALNEVIKEKARECGAVAIDAKGREQFLGVWDGEGEVDKFITMGAKKYASEKQGKIKITIAGVHKKIGAEELKEAGGLKMFKEGFVFNRAGGMCAVYNDAVAKTMTIDGHELLICDNVCLVPSTYTLGYADEYKMLLSTMQHDKY